MATIEQLKAAAEKAKAAGDTRAEALFRSKIEAASPDRYRAAAQKALEAGDKRAYEVIMSKVPKGEPAPEQPVEEFEDWSQYPQDANPKTDKMVGQDEFGQTIWQTVTGTKYARTKTSRVPMERDWSKVTPSAVGEALGNLATGIGQTFMQGLTAPGRAARGEVVTPADAMATGALAIPDANFSAQASRAKPEALVRPQAADDVAAAQSRGIPVYRTDVRPPETALGKTVQRAGENIPFAGTGGMRAGQQAARVKAAQDFVRRYGADIPESVIPDVADDLAKTRSAALTKYSAEKNAVISSVAPAGEVPTPRATAAIDAQIARLQRTGGELTGPVIAELERFKTAINGKAIDALDDVRSIVGDTFTAPGLAQVRSVGEKALSAIYGPLREDMGAFIRSVGGDDAFVKWKSANAKLSEMAGELKNTALRSALRNAEATPEQVGRLLFSAKPSDVARLYRGLSPEGRAKARTAIIQKALGGQELGALSPEKFKSAIGRMGTQARVFFRGEDFDAIDGLRRALKLTEHAGQAVAAPLTGVQNLPALVAWLAGSLFGDALTSGAAIGSVGMAARAWEATGVQRALRVMARAQTPKAQATAAQLLGKALKDAGVSIGQIAGQAAANKDRAPVGMTGN